jgi:hypothetical protein
METDLYHSLFAIVFFSGTCYLSEILTAVKQTSNPRGLKNGICISSPHPHPPPFKAMTIDKLVARKFYWQWSILPADRCWQGRAPGWWREAVIDSLGRALAGYSPTHGGHRCSVLVKDKSHSSHLEKHEIHRIIFHQQWTIGQMSGMGLRNGNKFRVLNSLIKWGFGKQGEIWKHCVYMILNFVGDFNILLYQIGPPP